MSVLGKLGKGLLKVGKVAVPIALAATGVGAPLAVGAAAALNAADKKASGGSWGDALKAGVVGGAMSAIPGGTLGAAGKAAGAGAGFKSALGAAGKSLLSNPATLATVGKTLSGGAKGMADSRQLENSNTLIQDRLRADDVQNYERALQDRSRIDMDQRELDTKTRNDGYRQALHAQYLQNWTPAQRPQGVEMVRGGFNTIPQSARDLAAQFEQQATVRALQGQKFDALPEIERFTPTEMKKASLWEKMAGAAGLGLQGAGAIADGMGDRSKTMKQPTGLDEDPEPWLGDFGGAR